ncbi:MAG: bifunctional (p)ppGpp synthetase/guanosine-3',5'-bis(diphosphate) 3'-pyrophosphohydrolase [Clostridia bacterium]|nr:bifunctional (p)ppGpp synthetase/guanosine-3',5'-bis(diphosphate) 3'-pyrophosphohydrolase [Clostridia bacterium]
MKNKINELLKQFDETNLAQIEDFLHILDNMQLNDEIKLDGVLYQLFKDGKISLENIKQDFESSFECIQVLNKLDSINYSQQANEAENLRKMFFAITKDVRIIMLKIATIVNNIHFLNTTEEEKKILAKSIFSLYAPLAARLGLSKIKTELEDTAFYLDNPSEYLRIKKEVDNRFSSRLPIVDNLCALVNDCLKDLNITGRVYGRKKHVYSIYRKLQDRTLDNIYDLIAVRAVLSTTQDCYALLGRIHSKVEPLQKRFKDYIAIPKSNGYQSLHTTVIFEGVPVEIQIRTEEMHKFAEYGVAAHWLYKEKKSKLDTLDSRLAWLRQMMENEDISIDELASSLSQDIYEGEIFVQTPKGKVIYLPRDATPIDFAYAIHSEVGNKCVGAKVNNKMVPTTTSLHNGDVVEIITNPNSKGPSRDWLKIIKTSEAKNKINTFFKKNMKEDNIKLGKTILENAIKEKGFSVSKLMTKKSMADILEYYNFTEENELFANIGTNSIPAKPIATKLATAYQKQIKNKTIITTQATGERIATPTEKQVVVKDLNNTLIKFAGCCHPMYGDDIIGFVSTGRGVIIHRAICPNTTCFDADRLQEAYWKPIEIKPTKNKK